MVQAAVHCRLCAHNLCYRWLTHADIMFWEVWKHLYMFVCVFVCVCVHACVCMRVCACMCACMCVCVHFQVHALCVCVVACMCMW